MLIDGTIVTGDDATWDQTVTVPDGRTIADAILAFFPIGESTAAVWKYVDGDDTPGAGYVEDDGAGGTGALRFDLTAVDTDLLATDWHHYTVRVKLDDDTEWTVQTGPYRQARGLTAPVQPAAP